MKYQYCDKHYSDDGDSTCDVNDGPLPRKICCCCKAHDANVTTNVVIDDTDQHQIHVI